ncbi:MAG: hypothetical protein CVV64_08220 [Candidatus Wallbacteria bacterium HGW-Wallbacteria-1]|jgi:flagellin|uniref:Flagellin n=1 Tax=Candidatus Wallbacteria bacterium HGW-Wallbacteria-1 TaxID=2013854 RepID=A0A2N1PRA0_9BACT|nr:MAG: hypothetical protein CVV64_08220 [Candidatus Wallbacteria bacterium HGW-Wallbacteria-1]
MRINNNIFAQNTSRYLNITESRLYKDMERLSSGTRINKAADDAAGLGISEKMRTQISGMGKAYENAQDGISLIQTAEGALDRIQAILRRLRDLSLLSANGDKTDDDRNSYQAEADQLLQEVDRITNTTEYNTMKLLTGTLGVSATTDLSKFSSAAQTFGTPAPEVKSNMFSNTSIASTVHTKGVYTVRVDTTLTSNDFAKALSTQAAVPGVGSSTTLATAFAMGAGETETITFAQSGTDKVARVTLHEGDTISEALEKIQRSLDFEGLSVKAEWDPTGNGRFSFEAIKRGSMYDFQVVSANSSGPDPNNDNAIFDMNDPATVTTAAGQDISITVFGPDGTAQPLTSSSSTFRSDMIPGSETSAFDLEGSVQGIIGVSFTLDIDSRSLNGPVNWMGALDVSGVMEFQVGPNNGVDHRIAVGIDNTSLNAMNLEKYDISSQDSAQSMVDSEKIDGGLSYISLLRGRLGASQNRLENTIKNLLQSRENIASAESRLRDADIAEETTRLTKDQIMQQAGTAMLAQANDITRSTLQLLS